MGITLALQDYLSKKEVPFETILHHHSDSAFNIAQAAHIPAERLVKAVMLEDKQHRQIMAIIPADKKLVVKAVSNMAYGDFDLMSAEQVTQLFNDQEPGVVPSIANAQHLEMLVDSSLLHHSSVYLETGDHESLIKLDQDDFSALVMGCRQATLAGEQLGLH